MGQTEPHGDILHDRDYSELSSLGLGRAYSDVSYFSVLRCLGSNIVESPHCPILKTRSLGMEELQLSRTRTDLILTLMVYAIHNSFFNMVGCCSSAASNA